MSSGNKNVKSMSWQEVPKIKLGWDKADPENIAMVKLQEKFQHKWVQEAEEAKKCRDAEEAKKRAHEAEEAKKRVHEAEEAKKRAHKAEEAEKRAHKAEEAKKRAHKAEEAKKRACEAEAQCQEVAEAERQREAKRAKEAKKQQCAESKAGLSINTLVNEVKIFGAEGYLPKPALESEVSEDKLQEALKEWMWQEEAALTKHLKGKGKEQVEEEEQEEEDQGTRDEGGEGEAK
ncbi:hypothetical protein ID866_11223 [Astraeus odoratus]|nr:hypothetical protein ID866_11223 [Astraeus odoratus]